MTNNSVVKGSLTVNSDAVTPSGNHKHDHNIVRANRDNGRRLVDAGLCVFPVHVTPDKKKRPIASAWTQLDSELTDEQRAAVVADFRKEHDGREPAYVGATNNRFGLKKIGEAIDPWRTPYGWSVSTGPSGLFVIDCDGAEAVEWFREFCEENDIDLSQCPQVATQSGGWHIYFADDATSPTRTAAGLKRWKSGDGERVAGIDLRAAGGQTVSPNTILTDGREYAAIEGTPDLATAYASKSIPAVPQVLLEWVAANRSKASTDVDDIEIAKLRAEIDGAPIPSFDEIVSPIGEFDFDSALSENERLRSAWESDVDGDHSAARMALANHLSMAFPGKLTATHYAAFLSEFEGAGMFDPEKRKRPAEAQKGRYDTRDIAREFAKAQMNYYAQHAPSDGSVFTAVEGEGGVDQSASPKKVGVKSLIEFCAEYTPVEFLLDGVIERAKLYTMTAPTGAGKTTMLASLALAIAAGRDDVFRRETPQGRVLYCSFENPDDFRVKLMAAAEAHRIEIGAINANFDILDVLRDPKALCKNAERSGPYALAIIDTLQAAFQGDDSNSNDQVKKFAQGIHPITKLKGRPSVIMAAHPVKGADKDKLVPYGGGALLNYVDGNYTLWKPQSSNVATLHYQGKFRGSTFNPISLDISGFESSLLDAKGRRRWLPVARIMDSEAAAGATAREERDALSMDARWLHAISRAPEATQDALSQTMGVSRPAAQRRLSKLKEQGLLALLDGKRVLTDAGRQKLAEAEMAAKRTFEAVPEEDDADG
ncbi:AAA family ATPase [Methylocystis suflitae]|uniref:AAA family ATPase n=1 Tax=Methylocystis suflitae TaxID=2951405 RepID=UPI00210D2237|nr:AAA family ATPase [Methylocystis suflitae]MCQ4189926.1 AAA family ATPase [Methylocystis suflitae]